MKLLSVAFRDRVNASNARPHETLSRVAADALTAIDYDAALVTVRHDGSERIVPLSNVLWMVPAPAPAMATKTKVA